MHTSYIHIYIFIFSNVYILTYTYIYICISNIYKYSSPCYLWRSQHELFGVKEIPGNLWSRSSPRRAHTATGRTWPGVPEKPSQVPPGGEFPVYRYNIETFIICSVCLWCKMYFYIYIYVWRYISESLTYRKRNCIEKSFRISWQATFFSRTHSLPIRLPGAT